MTGLFNRNIIAILMAYVAIALLAAAVLAPLYFSFVPLLLLVAHLYLWQRPGSAIVRLQTAYFACFALVLLFSPAAGPYFAAAVALPPLWLVIMRLQEAAMTQPPKPGARASRITVTGLSLLLTAAIMLAIGLLTGSAALLLECAVIIVCLAALGAAGLRNLLPKPVTERQITRRVLAGSTAKIDIELAPRTGSGGLLFIESPYDWLKVHPTTLSLREKELTAGITITPDLSGPAQVRLKAAATDRFGLVQASFEIEPLSLYVIPRARYAAWLAHKYLAETGHGDADITPAAETAQPPYGLRRGIEYYGSRLYQPGDSLRSIDWKHSFKHDELIIKEFTELHGQPAVILINLAAGNAVEADKLAYGIITTALSLSRENVPAALAIYDDGGVRMVTRMLPPQELVRQALRASKDIVSYETPVKHLNPPDFSALSADIRRLNSVPGKSSEALSRLLRLEYGNAADNARRNPVTQALLEAFKDTAGQAGILVISCRNHDAEALAYHAHGYSSRGNPVISVI